MRPQAVSLQQQTEDQQHQSNVSKQDEEVYQLLQCLESTY